MARFRAWLADVSPMGALGALLIIAVVGIPALFMLSVSQMAESQDEYARTIQEHQVASLERYMLKDFLRNALDYSQWDDAYENLVVGSDKQWFQDNVGLSSYGSSLQDAVALIEADGRPLFGSWRDEERSWDPDTVIGPVFQRLLAEKKALGGPDALGSYARVAGSPALVAVSPITRLTGDQGGSRRYLVLVRFLSDDAIAAFRDMMGQPGLNVVLSSDPVQFERPLLDDQGAAIAWLTWPLDTPGRVALRETLPKVGIAIVLLVGALIALVRRGQQSARELKASEARARHLSTTDPLTGLPNRRAFHELIGSRLAGPTRSTVFLMDLDGFKAINDTFGHDIGDVVLRKQADRLRQVALGRGIAARLGGDEFAIIADGVDEPDAYARIILSTISEPVDFAGTQVTAAGSVGYQSVDRELDPDDILRRADAAMYAAKTAGGTRIRAYEASMERDREFRRALEEGIKAGLDAGDFSVVYQPIVASASGDVVGVEALARWRDPEGSEIPPSLFVPVAEESNLIVQLGEYVLRRACADAVGWGDLRLSVNISTVQLMDDRVVDRVAAVLAETGFPARRLELEITESYLLRKPDRAVDVIKRLRAMGISISLDDFGTGYASIGYIQRFTIDKIKLDKSFV